MLSGCSTVELYPWSLDVLYAQANDRQAGQHGPGAILNTLFNLI